MLHKNLTLNIPKFVLDNQSVWWYYSINKRDNNQHKGEIDMTKMAICLVAIEILTLVKLARELEKGRCLFDLLTSAAVLFITNYLAWTL